MTTPSPAQLPHPVKAASGAEEELVVLVDDSARPIGTALKSRVHGVNTPLHLAFSCHVRDGQGRFLLTRRALSKQTWPGVWTNAFCGHPGPGESLPEAIARRADTELGLAIAELQPALPHFRYRATDASGVVENEICPVFTARTHATPRPAAEEVAEFAWIEPAALDQAIAAAPFAFSPWLVEQWQQLRHSPVS